MPDWCPWPGHENCCFSIAYWNVGHLSVTLIHIVYFGDCPTGVRSLTKNTGAKIVSKFPTNFTA